MPSSIAAAQVASQVVVLAEVIPPDVDCIIVATIHEAAGRQTNNHVEWGRGTTYAHMTKESDESFRLANLHEERSTERPMIVDAVTQRRDPAMTHRTPYHYLGSSQFYPGRDKYSLSFAASDT
ncbi:hypothetical protein IFM47457_07675 [Aspergillus lentulus]|nr:hypothetical protein IFM47457_07675 [Aspergillus lentulus]